MLAVAGAAAKSPAPHAEPLVVAPKCDVYQLPPADLQLKLAGDKAAGKALAGPPQPNTKLLPHRGLAPPLAVGIMLVRNGAAYLRGNFHLLKTHVFSRCHDWRLFYVENDSCDDTRHILTQMEAENGGKVKGSMLTLRREDSHAMCPMQIFNCSKRILMLASLRQRVLDMVLAWKPAKIYVNLDMDFDPSDFQPDHFWQMYTRVLAPCGCAFAPPTCAHTQSCLCLASPHRTMLTFRVC